MRTIWKKMKDTKQQFEHVIALCRDLFSKKLHDYGPAWRILRPASVTDQIFIKANRIRSIETKGVTLIDEGIRAEFIAIVNYGIIGLIQLELGYAESADISNEEAMALYDGETWAEGCLMRPELDSVCVCHAVHDICTHKDYSIPDLLRMDDFFVDVCITNSARNKTEYDGE